MHLLGFETPQNSAPKKSKDKPLLFKDVDRPMCYSFRQYLEPLVVKGKLKTNSASVYISQLTAALNLALEFGVILFCRLFFNDELSLHCAKF